MPATYTAEHLRSTATRVLVDFDPDADTATIVDLDKSGSGELFALSAGYKRFLAGLVRTVGTGNVDGFEIIAATDADGTGATVVVAHSGPTTANAVGDTIWLECDIEQVREVLSTATHVGVRVELATATDECVVYFERSEPTFAYTGLTADYIS